MKNDPNLPPQAIETEERVLSSVLNGVGADAFDMLTGSDFYRTSHRLIFEAAGALHEKGEPVDRVTVYEHLRVHNLLDKAGGAAGIARLSDDVPLVTGNLSHWCGIIREKAIRRQIIAKCNQIAQGAFSEPEIDTVLDGCQREFLEIGSHRGSECSTTYCELAESMPERWDKLNGKSGLTGVPSGLDRIDRLTGGFQPSDLIVIAARPGMGKTAFALSLAEGSASNGFPVLVFSLEMPADQLYNRHTAKVARVDSQKFRVGGIHPHEWRAIMDAQEMLHKLPITIDDTPRLHYGEIVRRSRRAARDLGVKLIIIDYLQLIRGDNQQRKDLEIADITGALKGLAKELKLPVILLSQLNRAVEARDDKRPRLSDLRESGAIEQDADLVAFIYRDEYYHSNTDQPGIAEINFAKHRNGPTGPVRLCWIGWRCCFENLTHLHQPGIGAE